MTVLPPAPPGLDALLQALRAAGLQVGAREVVRLRHAFALAPALGQDREAGDQLADLLASALVHDRDERRRFESVYRPWAERWADWARPPVERQLDDAAPFPVDRETVPAREAGRRPLWPAVRVAARLAAVALLALAILRPAGPRPVSPAEEARPVETVAVRKDQGESAAPARRKIAVRVRSRETLDGTPVGVSWPPFLLGGLALAAAGGLFWRYGRKPWIPRVLPDPRPGPLRAPLLPLPAAGPELLDPDGARTLIWGVGRHLTERLTRDLDLDATVRDTAQAAGLPELRFAPEKRLREVWLWLDGTTANDAMERWAEEVAGSLAAAGLPVRIGAFDGDPEELAWDEGQVFRPREVEAHRQTALVAVCSDGAALRDELAEGEGPRALLRSLAAWPRLAFVDFGEEGELAATVAPFGLRAVSPPDLPAFFGLGGAPAPRREVEVDPGEVRAWRAVLALGERPVDRAFAWAARREIGIELSAWHHHLLRYGEAGDPEVPESRGGASSWSDDGWRVLVGWLAEGSFEEPAGMAPGSLLDKALDFWERRLDDEAAGRVERRQLDAWDDALAERHLAMEQAALRLWREPGAAAEELYELASGALGETIRRRLERLVPRDVRGPADGRVPLPWRLEDLADRTRYLLAEIGLGGVTRGALRRPGRLGSSLGVLASLGLGLAGWGLVRLPSEEREVLVVVAQPPGEDQDAVEWRFVEMAGGTFRMGTEEDDEWLREQTEFLELYEREKPAHDVMVSRFWIGQTEVTNAQYRAVKSEHPGDDDYPAIDVSWIDARAYCQSLVEPGDWEYDLPTEAEWEYAARAGTTTPWSHEGDETTLNQYAWFGERVSIASQAHPVAGLKPNPWGLYDMHGNVWEWVLDCWDETAYRKRARDQPIPDPWFTNDSCHDNDEALSARVLRGGAFDVGPWLLRSAYRNRGDPRFSDRGVGFRCVRRPLRQH